SSVSSTRLCSRSTKKCNKPPWRQRCESRPRPCRSIVSDTRVCSRSTKKCKTPPW
ncbi:unnamed protein product, partial [Symbiodinium sp. CCMP2456]